MTSEREQYGFRRTRCACELCRAPCKHIPGALAVEDLLRLCPEQQDPFTWAEEHLSALTDKGFPTLVPARQANGHCHWLFEDRCVVHENAPFGCAFFDCHQPPDEVDKRAAATKKARLDDQAAQGLYFRIWLHLCRTGRIGVPGDRTGLAQELQQLRAASRP